MTEAPQGPTTGLSPHINIRDNRAAEAIDFYTKAFGATEQRRMMADDGKRIIHAHLHINGASLMLNDDFPEMRGGVAAVAPEGIVLHLQVDDADTWWDRATAAGAAIRFPIQDQFWGDRYGHVADPFGYIWSIGSPLKG